MATILIHQKSGFCNGVVRAIRMAEKELSKEEVLYCLGDIVHNEQEVHRLRDKGLVTITHEELLRLSDCKVLFRAHGEPPSTYQIVEANHLALVDATCNVVLRLQRMIKNTYIEAKGKDIQIAIYGKQGHAEVNGLVGQTEGKAIVIESENDLEKLDFKKEIILYSQTTKSVDGFERIVEAIAQKSIEYGGNFRFFNTICHQLINRFQEIINFASSNDITILVSGKGSSNGKELFEYCKKKNPLTYMISSPEETEKLPIDWTQDVRIGICGATSTPRWLMENVEKRLKEVSNK